MDDIKSLDGKAETCSRSLSRRVRSFIAKEIFSELSIDPRQLPKTCQLNPLLDPYIEQEKNKIEIQKGEWKCQYCNKVRSQETNRFIVFHNNNPSDAAPHIFFESSDSKASFTPTGICTTSTLTTYR
jgi:hypothetical protein